MRGKLIFPFVVELAQLDTVATAADPDGAGALTSGYDHVFREAVRVSSAAQEGVSARAESALRVRAQIEPTEFDSLSMRAAGDSRNAEFVVILHFTELEARGLVDAAGAPKVRPGDRLAAIRRADASESVIFTIPALPGLYVQEVTPLGFGIGLERNLLLVRFRDRAQAASR